MRTNEQRALLLWFAKSGRQGKERNYTAQNINTNFSRRSWMESSLLLSTSSQLPSLSTSPFLKLHFPFSPFSYLLCYKSRPASPVRKDLTSQTDIFCFFVSTSKARTHPIYSAKMPRSRNDSASSVGSQVSFQLPTELSVRDPIVRRATPFPL